jgi:hypothetical protein
MATDTLTVPNIQVIIQEFVSGLTELEMGAPVTIPIQPASEKLPFLGVVTEALVADGIAFKSVFFSYTQPVPSFQMVTKFGTVKAELEPDSIVITKTA